jgi:hypothetical protein
MTTMVTWEWSALFVHWLDARINLIIDIINSIEESKN